MPVDCSWVIPAFSGHRGWTALIVFDCRTAFAALLTMGVSILFGIVEVKGLFDFILPGRQCSLSRSAFSVADTSFVIFNSLDTDTLIHRICLMATSRQSRGASKPEPSPKTIQRTYRFDTKVFEAFEDDCARHLSNPKRVIEALILFWLEADPKTRGAMAQEHRRRIGAASEED